MMFSLKRRGRFLLITAASVALLWLFLAALMAQAQGPYTTTGIYTTQRNPTTVQRIVRTTNIGPLLNRRQSEQREGAFRRLFTRMREQVRQRNPNVVVVTPMILDVTVPTATPHIVVVTPMILDVTVPTATPHILEAEVTMQADLLLQAHATNIAVEADLMVPPPGMTFARAERTLQSGEHMRGLAASTAPGFYRMIVERGGQRYLRTININGEQVGVDTALPSRLSASRDSSGNIVIHQAD